MSDIGTCDQCDASMRPTLLANVAFTEGMKLLKRQFPKMSVRLTARKMGRLLCDNCTAAGHSRLRPKEELEDALAQVEEDHDWHPLDDVGGRPTNDCRRHQIWCLQIDLSLRTDQFVRIRLKLGKRATPVNQTDWSRRLASWSSAPLGGSWDRHGLMPAEPCSLEIKPVLEGQ